MIDFNFFFWHQNIVSLGHSFVRFMLPFLFGLQVVNFFQKEKEKELLI
jgi:hypothetical protein